MRYPYKARRGSISGRWVLGQFNAQPSSFIEVLSVQLRFNTSEVRFRRNPILAEHIHRDDLCTAGVQYQRGEVPGNPMPLQSSSTKVISVS